MVFSARIRAIIGFYIKNNRKYFSPGTAIFVAWYPVHRFAGAIILFNAHIYSEPARWYSDCSAHPGPGHISSKAATS